MAAGQGGSAAYWGGITCVEGMLPQFFVEGPAGMAGAARAGPEVGRCGTQSRGARAAEP